MIPWKLSAISLVISSLELSETGNPGFNRIVLRLTQVANPLGGETVNLNQAKELGKRTIRCSARNPASLINETRIKSKGAWTGYLTHSIAHIY